MNRVDDSKADLWLTGLNAFANCRLMSSRPATGLRTECEKRLYKITSNMVAIVEEMHSQHELAHAHI